MSSLKFGTSGLRGLVTELLGEPAALWTAAFLRYLENSTPKCARTLYIGRDLRSSSPAIAGDCAAAAANRGWLVVDCGALPTPALALAAREAGAPAVMVTGSHIPDDRNGLKFYTEAGEITKDDEAGILAALPKSVSLSSGGVETPQDASAEAMERYRRRYTDFFGPDVLKGLRVGVYQQSSVARDVLTAILADLGAAVIPFERADRFIPVDTEAHRPEDLRLLREWAGANTVDAIVSCDGDADRPLVADAASQVVRGDLLGLLTSQYLGLGTVVTPITSSAAVETSGVAQTVIRTRVGSPYVIAAMDEALSAGANDVVGFEANGGVLLASDVECSGRRLGALPTRDAVLPIICALASARSAGVQLREVVDRLGAGHALADRLKEIPAELSAPLLARLADDPIYAEQFFAEMGEIDSISRLDGVRFLLSDGSTVHFRASGNAPEFRCYVEAQDAGRASLLLDWGLAKARAEMRAA